MARRVKNQSKSKSWLEQTREDWKQWRSMIASHSAQAKEELRQLEEDYQIKLLMEHPERYEGSRSQISEFMNALEDLKAGALREKLRARGGAPESTWKEREKVKVKAQARAARKKKEGKTEGIRKVTVKMGIDPKTGEKIPIIERAKKGERETIEGIRPGEVSEIEGTESLIGNVGGVIYKVTRVKTPSGSRYQFNVTKLGRRLLPVPGAPPLYDHPDENKLFHIRSDADIRARRIINAALIWYEEHRSKVFTPQEHLRKAGHRKETHEKIKGTRTTKMSRDLREAWEKKTGKKAKSSRGRISNPLFGGKSDDLIAQAKSSLSQYKSEFRTFERSMGRGNPDFGSLMSAYDWLENARANYSLAEEKGDARSVQARKEEVRDSIVSFMAACDVDEILDAGYRMGNPSKKRSKKKGSKKNPTKETHQKLGTGFLNKSEKSWAQYCKTLKIKDLLIAYENLILSEQELGYAKDKNGLAQARAGLKAARDELASLKK